MCMTGSTFRMALMRRQGAPRPAPLQWQGTRGPEQGFARTGRVVRIRGDDSASLLHGVEILEVVYPRAL